LFNQISKQNADIRDKAGYAKSFGVLMPDFIPRRFGGEELLSFSVGLGRRDVTFALFIVRKADTKVAMFLLMLFPFQYILPFLTSARSTVGKHVRLSKNAYLFIYLNKKGKSQGI
jgi:hypothetical protein